MQSQSNANLWRLSSTLFQAERKFTRSHFLPYPWDLKDELCSDSVDPNNKRRGAGLLWASASGRGGASQVKRYAAAPCGPALGSRSARFAAPRAEETGKQRRRNNEMNHKRRGAQREPRFTSAACGDAELIAVSEGQRAVLRVADDGPQNARLAERGWSSAASVRAQPGLRSRTPAKQII